MPKQASDYNINYNIKQHLMKLNWAYYEQEKYGRDAYDQQNGQRWFLDAKGRVETELRWFDQHSVRVVRNEHNEAAHQYEVEGQDHEREKHC